MRNILLTALLLGCFTTFTSAGRGLFEFHDSQGRCWRCLPGTDCVRCPAGIMPYQNFPLNWDRTCPAPDFNVDCAQYPGAKFPSLNINFYWICADNEVALAQCFCDMAFDMRAQACVKAEDLSSIGCTPYDHTDIMTCDAGGNPGVIPTAPPSNTPTVPTAPTESPTDIPPTEVPPTEIPTVPTDVPTVEPPTDFPTDLPPTEPPITQPPPNGPATTTESGGPGATHPGSTTTDDSVSDTPPPCVCVVWWPCWCNPCWNMPCHSCNGCVGMMG